MKRTLEQERRYMRFVESWLALDRGDQERFKKAVLTTEEARRLREGTRRRNPARSSTTKKTATRRRKNPTATHRYRAKYRNGKSLTFNAKDDANAVRYAKGLGKKKAGGNVCVSCRPVAASKKKTRRAAPGRRR